MFKSNEEMIAEIMPNENTILILKRDLQLRHDVLTKGTRVILRYGGKCGNWYEVISSNGCYLDTHDLYLNDVIHKNGEFILQDDVPKYPQRIKKFIKEYFMIDFDRTKKYNDLLEKKHINIWLILFTILWLLGLIGISITGWIDFDNGWCYGSSFFPNGNVLTGVIRNLLFCCIWFLIEIMGIGVLVYEQMLSLKRKNEKKIRGLLS